MSTEQVWRKSSYSGGQGGNCVEVVAATTAGGVMVRDSKDKAGPVLSFPLEAWRVFVLQVLLSHCQIAVSRKRSQTIPADPARVHPRHLRYSRGDNRLAGSCSRRSSHRS